MARPPSDKLERLTTAAAALAYTRGFERTSIGDIADQADVAPGSVYYYFKTKDDVGRAIVNSLLVRYQSLLEEWEASDDPRVRLAAYLDMNLRDATSLREYGCPIGSLCTELRKHSAELGDEAAAIFRMTIAWGAQQFEALGFDPETAEGHSMHLLTGVQGAALLSNALGSTQPIEREADRLKQWIAIATP